MPHELFKDSMAFVDETPWHGLGTRIPQGMASDDMINAANLDWQVRKRPAPGARMIDPEREAYDRYIVMRDKVGDEQDDVALAIVGHAYEILQNTDAFAFFEPFIDHNWASFHTAGALGNGERVWVLARGEHA